MSATRSVGPVGVDNAGAKRGMKRGMDEKVEISKTRCVIIRASTVTVWHPRAKTWYLSCFLSQYLQQAGILLVRLKQKGLLALKDAGEMFHQSNWVQQRHKRPVSHYMQ